MANKLTKEQIPCPENHTWRACGPNQYQLWRTKPVNAHQLGISGRGTVTIINEIVGPALCMVRLKRHDYFELLEHDGRKKIADCYSIATLERDLTNIVTAARLGVIHGYKKAT